MHINCLSFQEGLFETRLLRRVCEPIFVDPKHLLPEVDGPLVLYGQWHPQGIWAGLRWLARLVYNLPHPCFVLPPFESGSLSDTLGLTTQLKVRAINTNRIYKLHEAEPLNLPDKQILQIQTDFAFSGPAGRPWLIAGESSLAALMLIQPKNTSTPLLLCGARLLGASGLSNDEDRLSLLEHIITWAQAWQPVPGPSKKGSTKDGQLDEATWHAVCIVLAGTKTKVPKEIVSLASTLFGAKISKSIMQLALDRLSEYGLAKSEGESLNVNLPALEDYTQQNGLWAYVRSLRKDFERIES
ncbi:hypothetical protein D4S03_11000 [bacterium]|nr:MAG: hypothetical protein D4S03_11000 [bacterium]